MSAGNAGKRSKRACNDTADDEGQKQKGGKAASRPALEAAQEADDKTDTEAMLAEEAAATEPKRRGVGRPPGRNTTRQAAVEQSDEAAARSDFEEAKDGKQKAAAPGRKARGRKPSTQVPEHDGAEAETAEHGNEQADAPESSAPAAANKRGRKRAEEIASTAVDKVGAQTRKRGNLAGGSSANAGPSGRHVRQRNNAAAAGRGGGAKSAYDF